MAKVHRVLLLLMMTHSILALAQTRQEKARLTTQAYRAVTQQAQQNIAEPPSYYGQPNVPSNINGYSRPPAYGTVPVQSGYINQYSPQYGQNYSPNHYPPQQYMPHHGAIGPTPGVGGQTVIVIAPSAQPNTPSYPAAGGYGYFYRR